MKHILFAILTCCAGALPGQQPYYAFSGDSILDLKIIGNYQALVMDAGDDARYHDFTMVVNHLGRTVAEDSIEVKLKTRGNFRRMSGECRIPPIMVDFPGKKIAPSNPFYKQRKLKLVVPCASEQHLLSEYLVYRLYNHVTVQSFQVQLVRIQFANLRGAEYGKPFHAFFIENEDDLAARIDYKPLLENLPPQQNFDRASIVRLYLFQFLIGNTDWSVTKQHNVKSFVREGSAPIAIPYDFDFCGMVNSPYASPPAELHMTSVRERRYRGFCMSDMVDYTGVLDYYKSQQDAFASIIQRTLALSKARQKEMLGYLNSFYTVLENDKLLARHIMYPCNPANTGNVTIQGYPKAPKKKE